ncbi:hypothetical protein HDU96_005200 [Phlyctochytrium bullatum]|nr:hypothetical protein HDU96_005200 [Phlyctochytrium bullatum]
MSRTASFVVGVSAGVVGGIYLAQTYGDKVPNVESTVKDLIGKAQVAFASIQKSIAAATATAPAAAAPAAEPAKETTVTTTVVEEVVIVEQPKPNTN